MEMISSWKTKLTTLETDLFIMTEKKTSKKRLLYV